MGKKRTKKRIFREIYVFCLTPKSLPDIVRKLNTHYKYVQEAVELGFIKKTGEKSSGWSGPKAHIYQSVRT